MKINGTVKKETGYIAIGQLIMTALMFAVFLVIKKFSLNVFLGGIVSSVYAVINFFLMGLTVQKALDNTEENMKGLMKFSQSIRLLLCAVVIIVAVAVFRLDMLAVVIPLVFPRITITVRAMAIKNDDSDSNQNNTEFK